MDLYGKGSRGFSLQYILPSSSVSSQITIPPTGRNVTINETFNLTCEAEGFPVPNIEWTFQDNITQENNINITLGLRSVLSTLFNDGAEITDTGSYVCVATNGVGVPDMVEVVVMVQGT